MSQTKVVVSSPPQTSLQKSDWKLHQLECQALSKLDKNRIKSLTPSIRLMVKLFIRKKLQCEKVLISYIETAGSTLTRQKTLKEQYYFTCTCPRCSNLGQPNDIEESSVLEGYRCKDAKCNGFLLRDSDNKGFICQQCGLLRDREELKKILGELKSTAEKASMNCSSGNRAEASALYKMIEKLQLKLCHPFSLNLMRTRETILKISMELQDWGEALAYCKLTIPVYESMLSVSAKVLSEIISFI